MPAAMMASPAQAPQISERHRSAVRADRGAPTATVQRPSLLRLKAVSTGMPSLVSLRSVPSRSRAAAAASDGTACWPT